DLSPAASRAACIFLTSSSRAWVSDMGGGFYHERGSQTMVERERWLEVGAGTPASPAPMRLFGQFPAQRRSHDPQRDTPFGDEIGGLGRVAGQIVEVLRLTPAPGAEDELVLADDRRPTAVAEIRDDQPRRWLRIIDQRHQALALPARLVAEAQ